MEVHHHPQVEHKSPKEYFLEGLMIFVAVTLGFFAENIREKITEEHRAEEFAASMVNDLKADTTELRLYRAYFAYAASNVDTLMHMLSLAEPKNIPSGKLYWYGLWGGARRVFVPHDATFQQMKSSGSLRYFTNTVLAKEVAQYDQLCRWTLTNQELSWNLYTEVRMSRARLFEFKYNEEANAISQTNRISFNQTKIDSFIRTNPPLLSYDKPLFNEYVELVRSRFLQGEVTSADTLLNRGSLLISALEKEYHLEH
jgi:hypothetical protein